MHVDAAENAVRVGPLDDAWRARAIFGEGMRDRDKAVDRARGYVKNAGVRAAEYSPVLDSLHRHYAVTTGLTRAGNPFERVKRSAPFLTENFVSCCIRAANSSCWRSEDINSLVASLNAARCAA